MVEQIRKFATSHVLMTLQNWGLIWLARPWPVLARDKTDCSLAMAFENTAYKPEISDL